MTYTIITNDGLIMFREDIFATREEAEAYVAAEPLTRSGKPQYACDTETALGIQADVKAARKRAERALQYERESITRVWLHNSGNKRAG